MYGSNGGTALNLNNNSNTLANLVFAADGGSNSNQGSSVSTGTGTLTLTGNITATNLVQATTIPVLQGNLALAAGTHTVNVGTFAGAPGQVGLQLNSVLTGTGAISKTGNGILGIGNNSAAFAGSFDVSAGSIQFVQNAATATFRNDLRVTGAVNLGAAGTLNAGGFNGTVGALSGTGTVTNSVNGIFNVTSQIINNITVLPQVNVGADNGTAAFDGTINSSLIFGKVGTGNQTLTNSASSYTGGTVVNGGTLTLGGGAGVNVTGTGLVAVNDTGAIAGTGAVTGGLQFNSGSAAAFNLGAPAGAAPLTTPASVNSAGLTTFNITGTTGAGTYPLIDYSGTAITANQMAGMKIGATPGGGLLYGLVNNGASTSIDLVVQSVNPTKTWNGSVNGTWDTATSNWPTYSEGDQVVFNNAGLVKTIVGGARTPQAITVTNSGAGNDYSIANDIGGALAGGLSKNGTGLLRLTGNNTFGGAIAVNAGTVRANVTSTTNSLGSGSVSLANGTTLRLDGTANTSTAGLTGRIVIGGLASGGQTANNFYGQTSIFTGTFFTGGTTPVTGGTAPFFPNGVVNNFGAQFTGKLKIDVAGPWSFTPRSDDGTRVFIDGVFVVNNEAGKGTFGASNSVMLTAGLHDIRFEYGQGTGGDDASLYWQGPGVAKAFIPAANIFTAESVTSTGSSSLVNAGTNVSVSGSATLNLSGGNFTGVQLGTLTAPASSTLNVTGDAGKLARAAGTVVSGGTVTFNTTADLALGQVSDGGTSTTIVKQGAGRLVLDNTNFAQSGLASNLAAGTIIEVQGGKLVAQGYVGGANPLSGAQVRLNGGGLLLDSKQGNATFNNAITVSQSALIEVVPSNLTQTLGGTNGVALNGGSTLTFDLFGGARTNGSGQAQAVGVQGAALTVAGAITGTGNLAFRSTQFDQGMYPVFGSATLNANNTAAGTTTLTGGLASQNVINPLFVTLNGQGRLSGSTGVVVNQAQLTIDDSATVNTGRINATTAAPLTLRAGSLNLLTSTTANSGETLGVIAADSGWNRIILQNTPGAGFTGLLTGGSLVRNNRATVQFQGTSLGGAATNSSLVKFTTVPTLTGGGGAAATSTISILPYAVGASNPGTNPPTYMPVTYDATNGIRPINTTTEITQLTAAVANGNTRSSIGGATTTTGPATVNTLLNSYTLDNSSPTAQTLTLDTNVLNFSGGAGLLLLTATNGTQSAITIASGLAGNGINFGTTEGNIIVTNTAGATIGVAITGSNGITVSGTNNINTNNLGQLTGGSLTLTGANTYTGVTTINGRLVVSADTALGNVNAGINFGGGTLVLNAATTLAATRTVTLHPNSFGTIDTATGNSIIAGQVTGSGGLVKTNLNRLMLSATNNNYSGTTTVFQGDLTTSTGPQGNIIISGAVDNGAPASAPVSNVTFAQTTSGTYTGNISGQGSVTITANAGNVITFGDPTNANVGVNTYAGGTTFGNANAVTLRGTTSSLVGGIVTTAASSQAIVMEQSFSGTANNVISGPATFLKAGSGAITVVNPNTYTGATTISAGTLIAATNAPVSANGAFGNAASAIVLGDAATTTNNSSVGLFTGGAVTIARPITIANQATTGSYSIGGAADETSTISGAISTNQNLTVTQAATTLTNALNITGGISSANAGNKLVTFSGGVINVATTGMSDGAGQISASITDGVVSNSAVNTYTGDTGINGGTFILSGSLSGSVSLSSGVLSGNGGLIAGLTTLGGGTVKPGDVIGTTAGQLSMNGGLTFNGASAAFDLNGLTAGTGYDQLSVVGAVSLNSNVPFTLTVGFQPTPADVFTLVSNDASDSVTGGFAFSFAGTPLTEGAHFLVDAHEFAISYAGGTNNNDVTVTYVVPEPGSAALLLGGLAMLAGRRRKQA